MRFKLKNIPLNPEDIISLKLRQINTKLIEEITQICDDIRKAENIDNLALIEKLAEKLREYKDIHDKYLKHTRNM